MIVFLVAFIICFAVAFFIFKTLVGGVLGAGKTIGNVASKAVTPATQTTIKQMPIASAEALTNVAGATKSTSPWLVPIEFNDRSRDRLHKASVDAGNSIDNGYVIRSKQARLPILAENEVEYNALTDQNRKAVEGDVDAICSLILAYDIGFPGFNKSKVKAEQLRRLVLDSAADGNRAAQAASMLPKVFGDELAAANRSMYEQSIRNAAENGDAEAQFAQGMFLEQSDTFNSIALLYAATQSGNSDAAYHLNKRIDNAYYAKGLPFPDYGQTFQFIIAGAEADNGAYASNLQEYVADAYASGECGLTADKEEARKWYMLARENGGAAIGLDHLDRTFTPGASSTVRYLSIDDIRLALGA